MTTMIRPMPPVVGVPAIGHPFRVSSRLLILALCLILAGIGAALFQAVVAEQRARHQVETTTEILFLLREGLRAGVDVETGQRGYLLTDDPDYLQPYERGAAMWLATIVELRTAFESSATPAQVTMVDRLETLARTKLAEAELTIDLVRDGRRTEALALVRSDEGMRITDRTRTIVRRLEEAENVALRDALAVARRVEARTLPILGVLGFAILALVALGFWLARRAALAEMAVRDAEELRLARARSDLLAHELNHRVKNLFAVILSIVSLSGRGQSDVGTVVRNIRERIHALSTAHSVSQGKVGTTSVSLRNVVTAILEPYVPGAGSHHPETASRLSLSGDTVDLPVKVVTPLGLVIHELATNAVKYGALSTDAGRVTVTWTINGEVDPAALRLVWIERGGPGVSQSRTDGFGSAMMMQAATQLDGRLERDWRPDGLQVMLEFPLPAEQ